MKHKVFIPVTDEMLYDYPELITAPLRPYQIDNPCFHWMATIESAPIQSKQGDETSESKPLRRFDHRMNLDTGNPVLQLVNKAA